MKKFKFISYILIFFILTVTIITAPAYALSEPTPQSREVVLIDAKTGNVLYSKSENEKAYPASTTKIMTVLLAVEAIEKGKVALTDNVTASGNISAGLSDDGSTAGIVAGETMTLESILYCAMLSSANEACNIIAEYIGGDIPSFIKMMNSRAQELGCTGTNFTNTHGYPDYNHYTTPSDLAKIAFEAYNHPLFMQICNTAKRTIPATNSSPERVLNNTNGLINADSEMYPGYFYEFAAGMKTGHTNDAGYCLVSSATKNDVSLICVVLGGQAIGKVDYTDYTNFSDSRMIYNWAFENYSYRDILETTDLVKDLPVKMGRDTDFVTVHPQNAVRALMPNDEDISSFEQKVIIYNEQNGTELVAPIGAGEVLGEITIEREGVIYGKSELIACASVDLSYSQHLKAQILKTLKKPLVIIFLILVLAFIGFYIYLVVHYKAEKKRRKREMEMRRRAKERAAVERKAALDNQRSRSSAVPLQYFEENEQGQNERLPLNKHEAKVDHDYFDEFFGKNKK